MNGIWVDLSMMPGYPSPNYYASSPLEAAVLDGADGMRVGGAVSPNSRYLAKLLAMSSNAGSITLQILDYLLYYPFVGMDTTDQQALINGVSLPRYTTGDGVQAMVVITNPPTAPGGLTFRVGYTNQDGASGRTTPLHSFGAGTHFGALGSTDRTGTSGVPGSRGPFLTLQDGDTGIRSIEYFQMVSGIDVGLVALVLVKPLAFACLIEQTAPVEISYIADMVSPPQIEDGAYINMIAHATASLGSTSLMGTIHTIWG